MWNEWVIDVTFWPSTGFCPLDDGSVVVGMTYIADRSPGKLVGVFHHDGEEAVDGWVADHPNWKDEYGQQQGESDVLL